MTSEISVGTHIGTLTNTRSEGRKEVTFGDMSSSSNRLGRTEQLDRTLDVVIISDDDDEPPKRAPVPAKRAREPVRHPAPPAPPSRKRPVATHVSQEPPLRYHAPQHPARTLPSQQRIPSLEEQLELAIQAQQRESGGGGGGAGGHRDIGAYWRSGSRGGTSSGGGGGSGSSAPSAGNSLSESDLRHQLLRHVLSWRETIVTGTREASTTDPGTTRTTGSGDSGSGGGIGAFGSKLAPMVRFSTAAQYQDHFQPLLLMELREELVKGQEERPVPPVEADVVVSSMPKAQPALPATEPLPAGQAAWEVTLRVDATTDLGEMDVVIVKPSKRPWACKEWPQQLLQHLPNLGVVVWRERGTSSGSAPVAMRVQMMMPIRAIGGKATTATAAADTSAPVTVLKIGQCTSAWREWLVLHKLSGKLSGGGIDAELLQRLLSATPSNEPAAAPPPVQGAKWGWRDKWKRLVRAVCESEALDPDQRSVLRETSDLVYNSRCCFSLVQGPPGTGKSTLLRALLNVLHNAATQDYFERVLDAVSMSRRRRRRPSWLGPRQTRDGGGGMPEGGSEGAAGSAGRRRRGGDQDLLSQIARGLERVSNGQKCVRRGGIMVCAQSNAAIDEVVSRLLRDKFVDEFGRRYDADVVRLGASPAEGVKVVSLKQRASDLGAAATGSASGDGGGRTAAEQDAHRKKMVAQRVAREKEQATLAKARLASLSRQAELQKRIERLEAQSGGQSGSGGASGASGASGSGGDVHALLQQNQRLFDDEQRLAQRIVELQLEMDEIERIVRSMDVVQGCLRAASPRAARAARCGRRGGAARGQL